MAKKPNKKLSIFSNFFRQENLNPKNISKFTPPPLSTSKWRFQNVRKKRIEKLNLNQVPFENCRWKFSSIFTGLKFVYSNLLKINRKYSKEQVLGILLKENLAACSAAICETLNKQRYLYANNARIMVALSRANFIIFSVVP